MLYGMRAEYGPPLDSLFGPSSLIAYAVAILLGGAGYIVLKQRSYGSGDDIFLARWFIIGYLLRVAFCIFNAYIFINTHLISYDTATYTFLGRWWVEFWNGTTVMPPPIGDAYQNYGFWVGIQYWLTGSSQLVPYFTNAFIGAWLPVVSYQIIKEFLNDHRAARFALLMMVFEPDLIAWSGIVGHDISLTLLTALFARELIILARNFDLYALTRLAVWVVLAFLLRPYVVAVLGAAAAVTILVVYLKRPSQRFAFAMIMLVALGALIATGKANEIVGGVVQEAVKNIAVGRYTLQAGAGDGMYMINFKLTSPEEILEYLPIGWAYLVFGPFPWFFHNPLYIIFLIPALVFWYFGLIYGVLGLSALRRFNYITVPLVALFLFGTILYGCITTSFIMAVRYRSQYGIATTILSSVGYFRRRKKSVLRLARPLPHKAAGQRVLAQGPGE